MRNILIPSKAEELQKHIDRMEAVKTIVCRGPLSAGDRSYARSAVDREDRLIRKDFAYKMVKDSLRKNMEEEPAPKLTMAGREEGVVEPQKQQ
jgi:hypothetical protein